MSDEPWRHWPAYLLFHSAALASGDVDPVYPVMRRWAELEGWGREERLRAVLLHLTYYHLGSTVAAAHLHIDQDRDIGGLPIRLPTGTARRAHRDVRVLRRHLHELQRVYDDHGTLTAWITAEPFSFDTVTERVQRIYGNGRWAAYKFAEMAAKVAGLPLYADTMAIVGSTGPAKGLRDLAPNEPVTEELAARLVRDVRAAGVPADPDTVETTICDFHSLLTGKYYVGYDIDMMQRELLTVQTAHPGHWPLLWQARAQSFPPEYLGELGGWDRPDPARAKEFRTYGRVVLR